MEPIGLGYLSAGIGAGVTVIGAGYGIGKLAAAAMEASGRQPEEGVMKQSWKEKLSCATACHRFSRALASSERRILSVYDHERICLECKAAEERRPDYESVSKEAIGQCLADVEVAYGDPGGYCYHHFYPFTCH